jgi:flavodoxin
MAAKVLVVYYSRAGHTARIAKEIARRCLGDVDEILEQEAPVTMTSRWHAVWRTLLQSDVPIRRPARHPGRYELVIIGAPVGGTGIPPAVRTYARQYADHFKRVAFFCAEGGTADERAFAELTRLCQKRPIATYAVDRKHLPVAAHRQGVSGFMDALHLEQSDERPA